MSSRCRVVAGLVLAGIVVGITGVDARAALTVLGTQYQQDELFPEYNCIWHDKYYPTSCSGTYLGGNVHVYVRNDTGSTVRISDAKLAGYSLSTVIQTSTFHNFSSIYYYWDNPPADIMASGEPVWYKADPSTIQAGGVAQVVIRLRTPPTTKPVIVGIVSDAGENTVQVPIDAAAPQLANVGFSQDRKKVYLHWRRSGGAAPATIKLDGNDVTASTITGGDTSVNYAESVITLSTPLPFLSYHVFQGVYADGKTATASLRAWSHEFIHAPWGAFDCPDGDLVCGKQFIDDCLNRGMNALQNQFSGGGVGDYLASGAGRAYCASKGFGVIVWGKGSGYSPLISFIEGDLGDEPDAEEDNASDNDCGIGKRLECGHSPMGILAKHIIAVGETYRQAYPSSPTTVNMNGTYKPENYYSYGQAVDVLQVDPYYQKRLKDTYWFFPQRTELYKKATYNYAVALATARAAEPNSAHIVLQSTETKDTVNGVIKVWPFATPEAKRIEAYYSLAGGAKGISYWWFATTSGEGSNGLGDQSKPEARAVWKEMGIYGNEIKTISPQLVTSHPVAMPLAPSANVWARALACGTDTIILLAVNDNYYTDETNAFHHTDVANASVVATLPAWMTSLNPTAFEVRPSGLYDVSTSLNGSALTVQLGTLNITKMIVITTNSALRATVQQRYDEKVAPGICILAPEYCPGQTAPAIVLNPQPTTVAYHGTTSFSVGVTGSAPLSYQWQKNLANLANSGHYDGATTSTLVISSADSNDAADYRCVVTNSLGSATSAAATLTVLPPGIPGDFDNDRDVDQADFGHMQACVGSITVPPADPNCADANLDKDTIGAVSAEDIIVFQRCITGPGVVGDSDCAN